MHTNTTTPATLVTGHIDTVNPSNLGMLLESQTGLRFPKQPTNEAERHNLDFALAVGEAGWTFFITQEEPAPGLVEALRANFSLELTDATQAQWEELKEWGYRATRWIKLFRA